MSFLRPTDNISVVYISVILSFSDVNSKKFEILLSLTNRLHCTIVLFCNFQVLISIFMLFS